MPIRKQSSANYAHIFMATKPLSKIYLGATGSPTFSVTFANLASNRYYRYDTDGTPSGSISPTYFGTQLESIFFYYSTFSQQSSRNTYQLDFATTYARTPTELEINGRTYALTRLTGITVTKSYATPAITRTEDMVTNTSLTKSFKVKFSDGTYLAPDTSKLIWQNTNPPPITAFSVFPDSVDLDLADNEPTARVTFVKERTGVYWFVSSQYENRQTDTGSATGFTGLVSVGHYYIGTSGRLSGPPSNSHYYQFAVRNTNPNYQNYNAIEINGRTYTVAKASTDFTEHGITGREYWTTASIPNNNDWVTDSRLTLSIKFKVSKVPDKLLFTLGVTGTPGTTTATPSNITFVVQSEGTTSEHFAFLTNVAGHTAVGSSTLSNNNFVSTEFLAGSGWSIGGRRYGYQSGFLESFLKTKTPLTIEVDGTSYSLKYYSLVSSSTGIKYGVLNTPLIPTQDRVSASDLTKAINFELVDNEQVTLRNQVSYFDSTVFSNKGIPRIGYGISSIHLDRGGTSTSNSWFLSDWTGFSGHSINNRPTHIIVNGRAFPLVYAGGAGLPYRTSTITDSNFQASSTKLSWGINIRFSDGTYLNNTRSHLFQSVSGGNTYAQVYNADTHTQVGPQHSATGGANISATVPNINRPNKSTNYRLVARNAGGASHRDITLTITKNPTLSGLRRVGSLSRPGFTNYTFSFTTTGLPQPVVTYSFSGGQSGTVPVVHFRQGANPYTWNIINWQITMPNANAQSLTLTATNASGTATARMANINA